MRIFLSLGLWFLLAVYLEAGAEVSSTALEDTLDTRKAQAKGSCSSGKPRPKNPKKFFKKWTAKGKCPCWWDSSRKDCACCKKNGKQCGYPMYNFCWDKKKASKEGCPGVCNSKYTLSTKGFSCYSNPSNKNCAWCAPFAKQCEQNKVTGPASKGGNRCTSITNANYCKGVPGNCRHMSGQVCSPVATCKPWKKKNKQEHKQCKCNKGYTGNGVICKDKAGNIAGSPDQMVEVVIEMRGDVYTYPHEEGVFTSGPAMDGLMGEMEKAERVCQNKDICQASYSENLIIS